jgi:hypothetical protein
VNPLIEFNLGLLLFLPWFLILGVLFWMYPRTPRHAGRRLFDGISLVLATSAFVWALHGSQRLADPGQGHMWGQILATSVGYGVFLAVLAFALLVRRLLWGGRRSQV